MDHFYPFAPDMDESGHLMSREGVTVTRTVHHGPQGWGAAGAGGGIKARRAVAAKP